MMPNIELVRIIFYNEYKFHVPRSISFELSCKTCRHTQGNTHGNKHTHTDSDEYSVVAFCKNATIIRSLTKAPLRLGKKYQPKGLLVQHLFTLCGDSLFDYNKVELMRKGK